nr:AraC family transcriptional regulator [Leptolyngbya sp. FACHB-36]
MRPQWSRWEAEGYFIGVGLEPIALAHAAYETVDPDRVELLPHFATPDPLVCQLALALKSELEANPTGSRLYAEAITNLLAVHLLQHYCVRKPTIAAYSGGLSQATLRQVIDYIQTHLDQNLGLAELATVAQMSAHYFSQLFKQSTGATPHQFVLRCRVERAKDLLLSGESIVEVARLTGFADQSHLNRHIKRTFGVTPKQLQPRSDKSSTRSEESPRR